jgi:predicted PurR-regulated permease PerM
MLVLWPFLTSLIWAAILVSTSWPVFLRLDRVAGGRRALAASLMTLLVTVALLGPIAAVALAMADNAAELGSAVSALVREGLPEAPSWLARLPLVGQPIHDYWQQFAHDGQRLTAELEKLAKPAQGAALAAGRVVGAGVLDMGLSVFLAFFFFLHGEALAGRLRVLLKRVTGVRAAYLLGIARSTVTGVIYGILGTGLAQGVLATIGFAVAGVVRRRLGLLCGQHGGQRDQALHHQSRRQPALRRGFPRRPRRAAGLRRDRRLPRPDAAGGRLPPRH